MIGSKPKVWLVIGLAVAVSVGCAQEVEPDHVADARHDLRVAGHDLTVVDCVVNLARRDLERGPLDELAAEELAAHCIRIQESVTRSATPEPSARLAMVEGPHTLGDDEALDQLWHQCADGDGDACDRLFRAAPAGSDYETFGLTCGDRPDVLHCADIGRGEADSADR
jgi:hypothetical protein